MIEQDSYYKLDQQRAIGTLREVQTTQSERSEQVCGQKGLTPPKLGHAGEMVVAPVKGVGNPLQAHSEVGEFSNHQIINCIASRAKEFKLHPKETW